MEEDFKVGDWVIVKTDTFEYDGTARISKGVKRLYKSDMWVFSENHYKCNPDNYIEHWKPKPDEWCWFCEDPDNFPIGFVLDRFLRMSKYNSFETHHSGEYYNYCFPFIGEFPYEA